MNKKNIILVVSFIGIMLVSFYAGTKIYKNKNNVEFSRNLSGSRGQMVNQFQGNMKPSGGNVFGKIISKDENSITIEIIKPENKNEQKENTGTGSKIVFYTDTTNINKITTGTLADLSIGKTVNINGEANPDGSINAVSVQIR